MLPEALATASLGTALEAIHRALRVIRFRDGAEHMLTHMREESADEATRIAVQIIDHIERENSRPIATLSEEEAAHRIDDLSDFVEQRTKAEWQYDENAAPPLLDELRATSR